MLSSAGCDEDWKKRKQVSEEGEKAVNPWTWAWICPAEPPASLISINILVFLSTHVQMPPVQEKMCTKLAEHTFAE